jgi:hypothetical protein
MKIFEFLLAAYPDEFLDVQTLNYSRFCNFMKNLDSRILEKPFLDNLIKLIEKSKQGIYNHFNFLRKIFVSRRK